MFPCPLFLGPLFFPFQAQLKINKVHDFFIKAISKKQRKRKESLRTIGIGGIGKKTAPILHLYCWWRK
jgi:hypothetical protein